MSQVQVQVQVEVAVPVRTAYDQWIQFENFPRYMALVHDVDVLRPTLTKWVVGKGPVRCSFLAEVIEQEPDAHVRWRALDRRLRHRGDIHFAERGPTSTLVTVSVSADVPAPLRPVVAPALERWIGSALGEFVAYVESVGDAGLGWRGSIRDGRVSEVVESPPDYPEWPHG